MKSLLVAAMLRVAVLDTGLNLQDARFKDVLCDSGHTSVVKESIHDYNGHGTHVAGLIKEYAGVESIGKYCLVIIKYYSIQNEAEFQKGLEISSKYDIVNISGGGEDPSFLEFVTIFMDNDTRYIIAAGNNGQNLTTSGYYPASYNLDNMIVVGGLDHLGQRYKKSNYGLDGMVWELGEEVLSTSPWGEKRMTGTSMATAIHTGKYIKKILGEK